jgi:tetratricopeptide (TPR) repeat protein
MYSPHRVPSLWKFSPVLAAVVGIVLVGLRLLGVLPDRLSGDPGPQAAPVRTARTPKAPKAVKGPESAQSLATLTETIRREPNNVDALVDRAGVYCEQKEFDKALADYEQALRLVPDDAEAHFGRGWVHYQKDENDLALADFNEAIRLAPDAAEVYVCRGDLHGERKEYKEAVADFERALQLDAENAGAYLGRGKVRRDQKDYERALADFQKATQLEPDSADGYNDMAWVWATCPGNKVRNPNLALEHAGRACQLAEWKDPLCLDTYAAAHAAAGDFEQAVRWEKKALALADDVSKTLRDEMQARLKLYEAHKPYRLP